MAEAVNEHFPQRPLEARTRVETVLVQPPSRLDYPCHFLSHGPLAEVSHIFGRFTHRTV